MKNKILIFFGLIAIVLASFINSVNALNNSNESFDEAYLERNWARVELATKIQNTLNEHYNIKDVFKDIYPSYFGGMYISDDAKNLIIQIVKENIPNENSEEYSFYNKIINMDNSIKIEYVNNSFNELNAVNNYVSENLLTKESSNTTITSSYLDIMNNSVNVGLVNNTSTQQKQIKDSIQKTRLAMNTDIIKFSQAEEYTTSINLNAGEKFVRIFGQNDNYCSVGMRVKYNGAVGYLTAGHCAMGLSSFPTGIIEVAQFSSGQRYDYAFVKSNLLYIPTNDLAYTAPGITTLGVVNYCPTITAGMVISKAGARTGYTSGKVTGLNESVYYSDVNVQLYGMVKSDVFQGKGDSGGVVMIPRTDTNGGAITVGILSGGVDMDNLMYFTDFSNLPVALQNRY